MVQTPDVHLEQQLWLSLFNWDTVLKMINRDKTVCLRSVEMLGGRHWTELPYLSLLPLDKRTPRAHTGHRDKIQQELPSAEPRWLIFPTTTRVKGYTGIFFKTAVCWRPFYIVWNPKCGQSVWNGWVSKLASTPDPGWREVLSQPVWF